MKKQIQVVSCVAVVMFIILMCSTTALQFVDAKALADNPWNSRNIYKEFGIDRGQILVEGKPIALSEKSDDAFGFQRVYPEGEMFSAITGFYSVANRADRGVEAALNDELDGSSSAAAWQKLTDFFVGHSASGLDVNLTVNHAAQEAAFKGLNDQKLSGAVVAVEPKTGRILSLVSTPAFDPNELATHKTADASAKYTELSKQENSPLKNKAMTEVYPPGSTYKLVTASAAIESGQYHLDSLLDSPQKYLLPGTATYLPNYRGGTCNAENGKTTMEQAMIVSCNTTFALLGNALGPDLMEQQAAKYGIGQRWTIAGEFGGLFSKTAALPFRTAMSSFPKGAKPDRLAMDSIGQGDVTMTPLQNALIAATIANKGELMQPFIVQSIENKNGGTVFRTQPHKALSPIKPSTAEELTEMMVKTVEQFSTKAQVQGVKVAGKSGTAENDMVQQPHAWFTGFAPADDPQIAVCVFVQHGGTGGSSAAPIAAKVISAYLKSVGRI